MNMAQQKLYTEEQVIKFINDNFDEGCSDLNELTPIKLPSDKEIENFAFEKYHSVEDSRYKIIIPKEEPKHDYNGVHLKHCYQGEYEDGCKYGEDDCPAKSKEEPKQETTLKELLLQIRKTPMTFVPKEEYEYIGECKGNNGNGCFMDNSAHNCGCFWRKPKQETTLEEAAESKYGLSDSYSKNRIGFIEGAKWQQEQDKNESTADYIDRHLVQALVEVGKQNPAVYSEEDVKSVIEKTVEQCNKMMQESYGLLEIDVDYILEKFKKK